MEQETLEGQKITKIRTINSGYANNCIELYDDKDNLYRMKVEEIMKINKPFNEVVFLLVQKKKYKYLEVAI